VVVGGALMLMGVFNTWRQILTALLTFLGLPAPTLGGTTGAASGTPPVTVGSANVTLPGVGTIPVPTIKVGGVTL